MLNAAPGNYAAKVYNVLGEQVYSFTMGKQVKNEIDLSSAAKGMYLLTIDNGTTVYHKKIVVR